MFPGDRVLSGAAAACQGPESPLSTSLLPHPASPPHSSVDWVAPLWPDPTRLAERIQFLQALLPAAKLESHPLEQGCQSKGIHVFRPHCVNCTPCIPSALRLNTYAGAWDRIRGPVRLGYIQLHIAGECTGVCVRLAIPIHCLQEPCFKACSSHSFMREGCFPSASEACFSHA